MLPVRDRNPSGGVPWVVYAIIGANAAVFLREVSLPTQQLVQFVRAYGFVPVRATQALRGEGGLWAGLVLPAFSCMFLHGGWMHLIGNMWFLHIFGDNVEDRLGHVPFLGFYVLCGLLASAAQFLLNPLSPVPTVGASGAIAGVLGAYIVTWPGARIVTLVPMFFMVTFVELPAFLVLGMWFVMQLFEGVGGLGAPFAAGGVAYWAHVGGFLAGAALVRVFPRRQRRLPGPGRPPPGAQLPPRYWR